MTSKKKTLIIIISAIIVAGFMIDYMHNNINIFNVESQSSISSTWNNNSNIGTIGEKDENFSFPSIPIIVQYKDKIVGDIHSQSPVKIDISNQNFGNPWMPFIKNISYSFSLPCNADYKLDTDMFHAEYHTEGLLNVSGTYKFRGTISKEKAQAQVIDNVLQQIYTEAKKHIKLES